MTSILVVDDDDDIRALVGELLERAGHVVIKAPDGESALKLFYSRKPDLVVLDVSMPGLDGWEVLNRIRELSDVPVLMLTARAEELEKVRGLRAGADDYVTKPFGRQELLARVDALLQTDRKRLDDILDALELDSRPTALDQAQELTAAVRDVAARQ